MNVSKLGRKIDGDLIRLSRFVPYRKGAGPTFTLELYDLNKTDPMGKYMLGYKLFMHTPRPGTFTRPTTALLFQGTDFASSPMHAIDSDETVRSLMGFLTLRPGDTDADYFANYTPAQTKFAAEHAEALGNNVRDRYGEE